MAITATDLPIFLENKSSGRHRTQLAAVSDTLIVSRAQCDVRGEPILTDIGICIEQ
jgi:hypothetical protein